MAIPVGEENWLAYLDETVRNASDLETRVNAVEVYKRAVSAEPGSLRLWLAYCNYFWSLWSDCQPAASDAPPATASWSEEELAMGRELFSFGAALELWQQGYEAVRYRISDSHLLWDRWISLEMDLLSRTRTPEGIRRITQLYRNRLTTPHIRWDDTSQAFSSFLSEYNRAAWEESMKDVTATAQEAKRLIAERDTYELKLNKAARSGDVESQKSLMTDYLEWEMLQSKHSDESSSDVAADLCRGLYARALTGLFATDEATWYEYVAYLSSLHPDTSTAAPELLDVLRRAVQHCPWSGQLWSRYILYAEEAKLAFADIEPIKHAATSEDQLYKSGMESLLEMYIAWCGFLRRSAMEAGASDEAVDVADVGLPAALEDVAVVGKRLYGNDFKGDPKFRLERIYIQYLTEKKGAVDDARAQWDKMAAARVHSDSHEFWLAYYMWEMLVFSSKPSALKSPTPPSAAPAAARVPSLATAVLIRAVSRKNLDWPEKVLEVFTQHCNDHEPAGPIRKAADQIHQASKDIRKRREREQREEQEAYASYYAQQPEQATVEAEAPGTTHGESKRKRDESQLDTEGATEIASKRQKSEPEPSAHQESAPADSQSQQAAAKRDRENTTVLVENLPVDVTQTKLRQYFKEYGHVNNITALVRDERSQTSTALIEFKTPEEARSALLRDAKYFDQSQLRVELGHDLTVYVTNFPPAADDKYIRGIFRNCGEVLSIRWPSLKVNTHRRFCYVSFRDRASAASATELDGKLLEGRYRLVAKFSDPGGKKQREGALAEGREVHITNLDRAASSSELAEVFSKFGTVTRVNVPLTLGGRNRGFAFVDFETKDQAEKAVAELDKTKFGSQILTVELSRESKVKPSAKTVNLNRDSASPAPSSSKDGESGDGDSRDGALAADIAARTIALMGLPDTVNDARIRALVEPLGAIVKLVLQPARGGAQIEFADASTAGKASLQLDGVDFDSYKLRTGPVEELRRSKAQHPSDRIDQGPKDKKTATKAPATMLAPPPPHIRRPGSQRTGPKRGIGFVAAKKAPAEVTGSGNGDTNGNPAPKSNADFKAMFLSAKETKDEGNGV